MSGPNSNKWTNLTLGIDATNLRYGGGRTHLIELLREANPKDYGFEKVVIWGARETLGLLDDRDWLVKVNPYQLECGLIKRTLWQKLYLSKAARETGCDALFVPGGSYAGTFHPVVTMSQNLLPFEWQELKRYGISLKTLKWILLRWVQSKSFCSADGVIFLTDYAKTSIEHVTGSISGLSTIISHGLNPRFVCKPKTQRKITDYSFERPYRILYVSAVDQYKHQWRVVEAIGKLRQKFGWPLLLDLVGPPSDGSALKRLKESIAIFDVNVSWARYHGTVAYDELHEIYAVADLGVFASSCENMPNTLLETMAAGLPIASSDRGPMPEILGKMGVYFDPENPDDIERALRQFIDDSDYRHRLSNESFLEAEKYTWSRCSEETFSFIMKVLKND